MLPEGDQQRGQKRHSPNSFSTFEAFGNWLIRARRITGDSLGRLRSSFDVRQLPQEVGKKCVEKLFDLPTKAVRKTNENQSEKCSELCKTSSLILRSQNMPSNELIQQADSDEQLVELWLHGRPANTQDGYQREVSKFKAFTSNPFHSIKLVDLQGFADQLGQSLKPSSVHRAFNAVKSLLSFGHRLGYLKFDVGRALKLQGFRDELSEQIISETDVLRIIALEPNPRNRTILLTFYGGGFRVSEICAMKWKHLQERDSTGQITVFAKGDKTRSVLMPKPVWDTLISLRCESQIDAPVFRSRKKGHLCESAVWRVVKKATKRAGIPKEVSCHWFRHAHASHALDRGAPIHLVQATIGLSSVATTGKHLHARPSDSSGNYLPLA